MKAIFVVAALAALLAACGADPAPTPAQPPAVVEPTLVRPIVVPAPVATAPVAAPAPKAKAAARFAERAAYAKAKQNAAVADCLRRAADHNGDLCVFYGTLSPPAALVKEVSAATCRAERQQ